MPCCHCDFSKPHSAQKSEEGHQGPEAQLPGSSALAQLPPPLASSWATPSVAGSLDYSRPSRQPPGPTSQGLLELRCMTRQLCSF